MKETVEDLKFVRTKYFDLPDKITVMTRNDRTINLNETMSSACISKICISHPRGFTNIPKASILFEFRNHDNTLFFNYNMIVDYAWPFEKLKYFIGYNLDLKRIDIQLTIDNGTYMNKWILYETNFIIFNQYGVFKAFSFPKISIPTLSSIDKFSKSQRICLKLIIHSVMSIQYFDANITLQDLIHFLSFQCLLLN
jgi:hypothetical protein